MPAIKIDEKKCDGCKLCQLACSFGQISFGCDSSKEEFFWQFPAPLLWLGKNEEEIQIDICRHCENPRCLDVCVAGAIKWDKDKNVVLIDGSRCVGCWSCVMECPFGAIRIISKEEVSEGAIHGRAIKCDGCKDWETPLCARHCPTGALEAFPAAGGAAAARRRKRITDFGNSYNLRNSRSATAGKRAHHV